MILNSYILQTTEREPCFVCGEAGEVLASMPEQCVDCVVTSPPYFHKREYRNGGIGMEKTSGAYIEALLAVFREVWRVLRPTGSLWLNLGDSYQNKQLLNLPYRVAMRLQDEQGWVLRNTVIWDKMKGAMTQSRDNLPNGYEPFFHFVKNRRGYYYDADSVRRKPGTVRRRKGKVSSASGISGVRYRQKIQDSRELTAEEKKNALQALDEVICRMEKGEVTDFRMVIRGGNQRVTNGDTVKVSGRARELQRKGYYFLFYNPKGSMISDVWRITPDISRGRTLHFAAFPEALVRTPILLTCPPDGLVLDPFAGTGTTNLAAMKLNRRSVGIDLAEEYLDAARARCEAARPETATEEE